MHFSTCSSTFVKAFLRKLAETVKKLTSVASFFFSLRGISDRSAGTCTLGTGVIQRALQITSQKDVEGLVESGIKYNMMHSG